MSIFSMPKDEAKIRQIIEHIDYTSALDPFSTSKDVIDACQQVAIGRHGAAIARLGARQDGVLRAHRRHADGSLRDTVAFSILSHEWPAARSGLRHRLERHRLESHA